MIKPIAHQFVARSIHGLAPFKDNSSHANLVWLRMQRAFPQAVAAVLMPNHLHLVLWESDRQRAAALRLRLRRLLPDNIWEPVPEPQPVADLTKLRTLVRYVHLNPCRASLCADPISWIWSTHLDYLGIISSPWVDVEGNLKKLGYPHQFGGVRKFHAFVSSDSTTNNAGTALPETPPQGEVVHMATLIRAMALVSRTPLQKFYRKGRMRSQAMRLLNSEFKVPLVRVAQEFNVSPTAVNKKPWASTRRAVPAILRVMHDPRFRKLIAP